jgi:hypothetical protein
MSQIKIFVSYAHADFKPRPGFSQSRIGQIFMDIKYELNCESSRSPFKILRDAEGLLNTGDVIYEKLDEAMAECDAALFLLSENYVASEECGREFDRLFGLGKPLFLIEVEDIWSGVFANCLEKHRGAMRKILSTQFWCMADNKMRRFGYPMPQSDVSFFKDRYFQALDSLASSIKDFASEHMTRERTGDAPTPRIAEKCKVFLACPTSDVKSEAQHLEKCLEADGHGVVAFDAKLSLNPGETAEQAIERLARPCDIYVQLLGGVPGRRLGEAPNSTAVPTQYRIAEGLGLQMQVWRKPDIDTGDCDPDYAQFLETVTGHVTPFEEFEQYIRRKTDDVFAARQTAGKRSERIDRQEGQARRPLMAIDVAESDNDLARKIAKAFGQFVDVETLAFEIDRSGLEEAISVNDAVILGYGASKEGWNRANAHFKIIRKKMADAQAKRLELAVGDAAPPNAPPAPVGPNIPVITIGEEVDRPAMLRFLARLGVPGVQVAGA